MMSVPSRRLSFWVPAVSLLAAFALPATAAAQSREQQQTFAELRILQEQTIRLQQSVNQLAAQVQELKDTVKSVNGRIDSQSDQAIKNSADMRDMLTTMSRTVSSLEQRVGENNVRVQQVESEVSPIRQGLTKLSDAINQAMQTGAVVGTTPTGAAPAAGSGVSLPTSPTDVFGQANGFYVSGQYDLAIKAFKDYLTQFPDNANACKAQLYIGDSHVWQNKFTDAVTDYDTVIKQYKNTDCEPDAWYKQAKAYEQLKQVPKAVANYEYIHKTAATKTSDAWQSDDALAKQALARLNIKF